MLSSQFIAELHLVAHPVGRPNHSDLCKRIVQRWLKDGTYIETNYHHRHRSWFDTYEAYVRKRWDEGIHNIQ